MPKIEIAARAKRIRVLFISLRNPKILTIG
jgi:hypothetical protein